MRSPGAKVFRYDAYLKPIEEKKPLVFKPIQESWADKRRRWRKEDEQRFLQAVKEGHYEFPGIKTTDAKEEKGKTV